MRRELPAGVRMYTGDDFNYDRLILGDEHGHSDALLGIFDADCAGCVAGTGGARCGRYRALSRTACADSAALATHLRGATQHYKTGVVFLAYLNGFQSHFRMVRGAESARSMAHLCELLVLADKARGIARS